MPNSLRVKLSKLRYKGEITQEEYAELIKKLNGHDLELLDKVADRFPKSFCTYCNQDACEGGMVGTIQECETIRMIKDVLDDVIEDMKAEVKK